MNIQKEIVELASKFIKIPSVTGDIPRAVEILELAKSELQGLSFTPYASESIPSLLYTNQKNTKQFKIILNAHLDIVPGKTELFRPFVKDAKLYGRGAYDMKGAAAATILLFKELAPKLPYPLGLQLVTDEEFAKSKGTHMQLKDGVRAAFAIVGECGSDLSIMHENKGLLEAELTVHGQAAHGAYPWKGSNAIMKMYEIIQILNKHFPAPQEETHDATINVSKIKTSNESWNKIPDDCTVTLDVRFPKEQSSTIVSQIRSLIPKDVDFTILRQRGHHYTSPDSSYIKLLQTAGQQILGERLQIKKTFGGSDSIFFTSFDCEVVEFGPVGHGQHHDDEYVSIEGLKNYYEILKTFLLNLA